MALTGTLREYALHYNFLGYTKSFIFVY